MAFNMRMKPTYHLTVPQSPAKTLEVFTAELAHNVLWGSLGTSVPPAFDPWSHGFDFVLDKGVPGLRHNVHIAPLAEEVIGVFVFVVSHLPIRVEGLVAAWDCARHLPDGIEWYVHAGGECVGRMLMLGECWASSAVVQREWLVVCGIFWLQP
jgi:hypothetical protein